MLIKNVSILFGKDLEYKDNFSISIKGNLFKLEEDDQVIDAEGLLMLPAFINAHTHIGDSIAKDLALNASFDQAINTIFSIKRNVLEKSEREHIIAFMRNSILSMLRRGITTFIDFREGGIEGVNMLREANKGINARAIILARPNHYFSMDEIKQDKDMPEHVKEEARKIISIADGFGLSGANEYSNKALRYIASIADDKLLAIHAAESREAYERSLSNLGVSDVERIVRYLKPDMLIHMTNANDKDLMLAKGSNIVICPRANAMLRVGIPRIDLMLANDCNIAIGTDNVMVNSPDLFKEMDYLFKISRVFGYRIDAKDILKMVTINPAKILRLNLGYIDHNMLADAIFIDKYSIDLDPMHDPYASIVHRADASSIRAVMLNGEIVYGSLQ